MSKILLFHCAALLLVLGAAYAQSQPMPDLIVDPKLLRENWIVRNETFTATQCDAVEGGISAGEHLIVRFTVGTPNIGDAPEVVGDPNAHVAANDGLFEFAPCHRHFHFRHYALYELVDPVTGHVWRAAKRGFCMEDIVKFNDPNPGANDAKRVFDVCGAPAFPGLPAIVGNQGISPGFSDVYAWQLQGQYFVLDGGDGQEVVPPGNYIIRITVNPGFIPGAGEPCRFIDPIHPGVCHQLEESDYENNVTAITVTVPDHNGKQAVGPLANAVVVSPIPDLIP